MSKRKSPKLLKIPAKAEANNIPDSQLYSEPFSFAKQDEQPKNSDKDILKTNVFDRLVKSDMVDDIKKTVHNCVNSASCSISNAMEASNATTDLSEKLISKFSSSISGCIEQNFIISQDILKCHSAIDIFSLQKKIFNTNISNVINLFLDLNYAVHKFTLKNIDISSDYLDKNIKHLTRCP